jgi:DNA-binding GntR family transcriptional regulator
MTATVSNKVESQNSDSLAGRVERAVAQWIFRGELTAGEKLTEQDVAERLGVSRGPVRDAFRALEDVGLLQIEQNRGAYVRKIDFEEAVEIHDIYSALEELAARSAARQLSAAQIEELEELVKSMDAAAEADDLDRYYALNLSFHQGLGGKRQPETFEHLWSAAQRTSSLPAFWPDAAWRNATFQSRASSDF